MAQIVFIINDEDGAVNVTAAAEPYISLEEDAELTPAQAVAQLVAVTVAATLTPETGEEEEAGPQLEIVGEVGPDAAES